MTLDEIVRGSKSSYSLEKFESAAITAVQMRLTEKDGKSFLKCYVRNKDVRVTPEEVIRQLWLYQLTLGTYQYPVGRIQVEYPITFGRDTSKRADIVIMDKDRPTVPYAIIEVKQPTSKGGKDQLKSYCHATGAPLAVWSNGTETIIWHRKNPNYFVKIPDLPTTSETIDDVAGETWTMENLVEFEQAREAGEARTGSLKDLILDMENEVLANAGVDVFEEVFKLIFTKLYDEMSCHQGKYTHLKFRNVNTAAQVKESIQKLFDDAKKKWNGVFLEDERIRLTPDHLQVCVASLEEWKLFNSNLDIVDEAFEYLVNKSSKGEKGQYFTPRWVIDMCVKMLNPQEHETLIDTACGSAGFPVHGIFHVWKEIFRQEGKDVSHLFSMEKKGYRCETYVQEKVFAIDFDEKSVRVARCLNLIAGDGQTNVLHLNTLDYPRWDEAIKEETWMDNYFDGWKKFRKLQTEKKGFRNYQFDVLMANPPFAGDIKQTEMLSPYEMGSKESGKYETAVGRDLLFIERNLDFLKPGGRMAVVLPQGRFNNATDKRVRRFIAERCRILGVVGLHPNTFKPHTGTKTSVLLVQKWNDDPSAGALCPQVDDYDIFFATQKLASKDNSGDKIPRMRKYVSWWDGSVSGPPLREVLTKEQFEEKHGDPEHATTWRVTYPDGKTGEFSMAGIEAEFGSFRALEQTPFHNIVLVRLATMYDGPARDRFGHFVWQHDLFSTELKDGIYTPDGIAEAFIEFAKKEKLSFF